MPRQITCPECRDEGVIEVAEGAWYVRLDDCPSCGGSGRIDDPEDDGTPELQVTRAFVSPYLLRPLRTIEQAEKDMAK